MPIIQIANHVPVLAIGGGGPVTVAGTQLPSNSLGYLQNDGGGNLAWAKEVTVDDITVSSGHEKWDDLRLAGTDLRAGASAPSFTNFRNGLYLQGFVSNQVDEVHFTVQLPHAWKEGSDIHPHIHWTHNVASPGNNAGVVWKLEYSWVNIGSAFPATSTMTAALTWTTSPPAQHVNILTPFLDSEGTDHIVGLGKTVSSQLIGRLYRDTTDNADNWAQIALLIELDFHYQIDTLGSDEEYIKHGP